MRRTIGVRKEAHPFGRDSLLVEDRLDARASVESFLQGMVLTSLTRRAPGTARRMPDQQRNTASVNFVMRLKEPKVT